MIFKGLDSCRNSFLIWNNSTFKILFTFNKSLVFFLKVNALSSPVFNLSIFSILKTISWLNKLLSNLTKEIKDLNNSLIINLRSKLCQSTNQWFEKSVFTFSKFSLDLFKSTLNLRKSNTSLNVLNYLWSFINWFNLINMFSILSFPSFVLLLTKSLFRSKTIFILFNILCSLTNFLLSFFKSFYSIFTKFCGSSNLSLVILNLLLHISNKLFAGSLIILVNSISRSLLVVQGTGKVLKEKVNLVSWGTSGSSKLDHRKQWVTQSITVDFSQNRFGVLIFVLLVTWNNSKNQC